jgi:hypothetical protein
MQRVEKTNKEKKNINDVGIAQSYLLLPLD